MFKRRTTFEPLLGRVIDRVLQTRNTPFSLASTPKGVFVAALPNPWDTHLRHPNAQDSEVGLPSIRGSKIQDPTLDDLTIRRSVDLSVTWVPTHDTTQMGASTLTDHGSQLSHLTHRV